MPTFRSACKSSGPLEEGGRFLFGEALSEMPLSGPNTRLALIILKGITMLTGNSGIETKPFQNLTLYRVFLEPHPELKSLDRRFPKASSPLCKLFQVIVWRYRNLSKRVVVLKRDRKVFFRGSLKRNAHFPVRMQIVRSS